MPSTQAFPLAVATLAFLLAGFVKGVIGLGPPTVSMGLLRLIMAPAKAASLLIAPSFVTHVWQLAAGGVLRGRFSEGTFRRLERFIGLRRCFWVYNIVYML